MNVAVVTHFYPPEPCAAATRVASLVEALSNAGHSVTVVTNFPSFPAARFAKNDRFRLKTTARAERADLVRLASLLPRRLPGKRLVHWASSAVMSSLYLLASRKRFDAVIVSMPPITLALPALAGAWRHRARLIVDVRDVFPDIAIAMGEWRADGFLARASEWLVRRLYRRADLIVAVTPTAIAQIASRGVDPARLVLARNASEAIPELAVRPMNGRGFTAIYAGNLGVATDVDLLADAAALCARDGIAIDIVGDGAQRARLCERLTREGITNVAIKGSLPRAEAMRLVSEADVSIVPLRKGIEESVPTKMYDSIAVGCPVIVAAAGEACSEGAALGAVCTPPGDAAALAQALRRLAHLDRAQLRAMGEEGRSRLQSRAGRAGIMAGLVDKISSLA